MIKMKPNVLFILIDDMGWKDLSCTGSTFYETPNIDSIAKEGMMFTRAYASCPVCSPTRASIMTGKYPARVGITQWIGGSTRGKVIGAPYLHYLPLEEKSLARAFKEHGYKTYHVGKWHLGDEPYWPEHHGFDVNVGGCHMGSPWHGYFSPYSIPTLKDGPKGEYLTDRLTDEAIHLLEQNGDEPFFFNMWYYSVHMPIQVPRENIEKFEEKAKKTGLDKKEAFTAGKYFFIHENRKPRKIPLRILQSDPAYAGMIERLDHNIGRLFDVLKRTGKYDNTIIMFYSDNGGLSNSERAPTCNLPLRDGKSYIYEGGIREPLLVKWKGIAEPGSTCEQPVTATDFYPTLLEACGIEQIPDQHVDGKSFLPLLKQPDIKWSRGPIYWHYPHYNGNGALPASCIIDDDWKLIEWLENGKLELFNIKTDISEENDVSSQYPEIRDRLLAKLKEIQEETNAKMPEPNPNYPYFLANTYIHVNGTLVDTGAGNACIKARLTKDNPNLYDVPIWETIDPFRDRMVKLKIQDDFRVGRFHLDGEEKLFFTDTHAEKTFSIDDLMKNLMNQKVSIQAWDDIQVQYLNADEKEKLKAHSLEPQVEIKKIDKIDVNLSLT